MSTPIETAARAMCTHQTDGGRCCECTKNATKAFASLAQHRDDLARAQYAAWKDRWDTPGREFTAWDDLSETVRADWLADIDAELAYLTGAA